MNDDMVRDALRALDGERELAPDRAAAARAAMLNELDRSYGHAAADAVAAPARTASDRRWWIPATVAAAVIALVVGLVAFDQGADAPVPLDRPDVERSFLVACAEFQLTTRRGDADWAELLDDVDPPVDIDSYLAGMEVALATLSETPRTAPFRDEIRAAVETLRSSASPSDVRDALVAVEEASAQATGLRCLR